MKRRRYHLLDVFTDRAFGGNPLAVFPDGSGISDATMQAIAKELNLSETTFVLPAEKAANAYRVRIFTPAAELPMAGHPTVGTTFVLAREGMIARGKGETTIMLEEGVGPIPVSIKWKDGAPDFIAMRQPLPVFRACYSETELIAEMLSLSVTQIGPATLPAQVVSCGVPYLLVPIVDLEATRQIRVRSDVLEKVMSGLGENLGVFAFTMQTEFAGSQVHGRMFAPHLGIVEDAATGSAAGPLGCYLAKHQVLPSARELRFVLEQGVEMGRPSFLHVAAAYSQGEITAVEVGGCCHYMGSGELELDA